MFTKYIISIVYISLRKQNTEQLRTKNKKLYKLLGNARRIKPNNVSIPIKNLSSYEINESCLREGLSHCFVDKNTFIKRNIAGCVNTDVKEDFHEFLRGHIDKFTQNIYHSKDNTVKSLKDIRNNKNIVILSGDKDSSVVIMNKIDYINKVDDMINEGITNGKYEKTIDNTHKDLHNFQSFLQYNFSKHKDYSKLRPVSNQPARLFATAKTHTFFDFNDDITVDNIKLRPIVDQTNTHAHTASKIITDYLQPLAQNEYVINNTLIFADLIKADKLHGNEECVLCCRIFIH